MKIYPAAAFLARRMGKQRQEPNTDNIVAWAKKMWPLAAKLEETRLIALEDQVRVAVAAYRNRAGRAKTRDMLQGLDREVDTEPRYFSEDFA